MPNTMAYANALRMDQYNPRRPHPMGAQFVAALAGGDRATFGRRGDSMMGHLTPGEAIIPAGTMTPGLWAEYQSALDRQDLPTSRYIVGSGQNSINPATGQPEFFNQSQRDAYREYGESRNRAEGRSTGGTGRESRAGAATASQPGVTGSRPAASSSTTGGLRPSQVDAYRQYGETRAAAERFPDRTEDDWSQDPDTGAWGRLPPPKEVPVLGLLPAPIPQIAPFLGIENPQYQPGFEPAVPEMYSDHYGSGTPSSTSSNPTGRHGAEGPGDIRPDQPPQEPPPPPVITPPPPLPTPQSLGLSPQMTLLQQRSAIASNALYGGGSWTSPEARSYYINLLQRDLISDDGTLSDLTELLPVEELYLRQILGLNSVFEDPNRSTTTLLQAIANL